MKFNILIGCLVIFLVSTQGSFGQQVDSAKVEKAQRKMEKDQKKMDKAQGDVEKRDRKEAKAARKLDKAEKKKEKQARKLDRQQKSLDKLKDGSGTAHFTGSLPLANTRSRNTFKSES